MLPARRTSTTPPTSALAAAVISLLGSSAHAEVRFSAGFLNTPGGQQAVDLNVFAKGQHVLAGTYRPDIYLNGMAMPARLIVFRSASPEASATPCLEKAMLSEWGVLVDAYQELAKLAPDHCVDLALIPDASMSYDVTTQRLELSLPQIAVRQEARGSVSPERWDDGVTAGMLDYNLVATREKERFRGYPGSAYLNLRAGFNVGAWRLRGVSSAARNRRGTRWQNVQSYVERDIRVLKGRLTIGDSYTPGAVFDSIQFRGVQLASDDSMLPDSLQGYAPVVRGVAQTNARVEIRQNGYVIYQTVVAPGPFEIRDLYPAAANGDLEVAIVEADGRQTRYRQPFSAVPNMLRQGGRRYQFTLGKYRSGLPRAMPGFLQATYSIGLVRDVTPYAGVTYAGDYRAATVGVGKNLGVLGGISFDISQARTRYRDSQIRRGRSYRFLYAKSLARTGTDLRLVGYRYSTDGYRDFAEAVSGYRRPAPGGAQRKGRFEGTVTQRLGEAGSLYATLSQQTYWGKSRPERLLQVGYNTTWKGLNLGLYFSRTQGVLRSTQVSLNLSMPLDFLGRKSGNVPMASYTSLRDVDGGTSQQVGLTGTLLEQRNLSYSVYGGTDARRAGTFSAALNRRGGAGNLDLGLSQGPGYRRASLGVSGGVVLHRGGVTFSQPLQDTIALMEVPRARGVRVENQVNIVTDRRGYAVLPYVTAYRANRIALDTNSLGDDMEIETPVQELVPTRGAVVRASFDTRRGQRMLVTVTSRTGWLLPIGSSVRDRSGHEVAVAGTDGQVFLSGVQEGANEFKAQWGTEPHEQCAFSVEGMPVGVQVGYANRKVMCRVER